MHLQLPCTCLGVTASAWGPPSLPAVPPSLGWCHPWAPPSLGVHLPAVGTWPSLWCAWLVWHTSERCWWHSPWSDSHLRVAVSSGCEGCHACPGMSPSEGGTVLGVCPAFGAASLGGSLLLVTLFTSQGSCFGPQGHVPTGGMLAARAPNAPSEAQLCLGLGDKVHLKDTFSQNSRIFISESRMFSLLCRT